MAIVGFYAAMLVVLYLVLTARIIQLRIKYKASLGDANQELLQRAIRVHANFNEYVPLGLVLLGLVAVNGGAVSHLHVAGAALLIGRAAHALGVSRSPEPLVLRQIGMVLTLISLISSAGFLLMRFLFTTV